MKFTTKNLVIMAFFVALSVALLYIIHFPIFPAAPFLEYDPADIPILIGGFAFGPVVGIILTVVASGIQALTVSAHSGVYGFIMHVIATSTLVVVASVIYRIKHTRVGAVIGLVSGTIAMGLVMMLANHFITPLFMGVSADVVDAMLLPVILPFNLIKAGGNSLITFFVYKAVSKYIVHGERLGRGKSSTSKA
ncbi:MAG: ECF transporter S component [Clostridiales bacterium]|nr:ECF transporter S component [Clostridiales bacterium]